MKRWENWSIDCAEDDNKVDITGNSNTLDRVEVIFKPGVTSKEYIITYNDGIRCVSKPYFITCTCGCDKLVLEETLVEIPMEGCDDIPIGSFSTCIAEANILTAASETWADHCINTENNIIYLTVGENTSGERSSEIRFNYTICNGASCPTKILLIHQAGTSPSCDCTNVTWGGTQEADPTPTVEGLEYYAKNSK